MLRHAKHPRLYNITQAVLKLRYVEVPDFATRSQADQLRAGWFIRRDINAGRSSQAQAGLQGSW